MLNLSLNELRLIAKYRNISGYKSMPKDKSLKIFNNNSNNNNNNNNNNDRDRKRRLNQKNKKSKKVFISQQEIVFLN